MATDPVLRMLGLARRAGKLAFGDELVREACFDHKTRCVFIAGDAGANAAKKAAFYADKANVPCVTLPHGKFELGSAIGKAGCAMCAVADIGMAAAAVSKLAEQDSTYTEVAQQLAEKNAKIQSRKGIKKQKDKADFSEKVAAMRQGYNRRIEELRDTADPVKERKTEEYHLPRALREGDTVTVAAINRQGTVIAGPDKSGAYQIQLGNMKMKCAPEELRLPEDAPKPPKKKQPVGGTRTSRPGNTEREARTELDIRGMASDEGLMEVDRFLDRCLMMGIKNVTIIHGKGTGVLRTAVQQHLRRLGYVKSQRPGMYGEGEAGVTVVELK